MEFNSFITKAIAEMGEEKNELIPLLQEVQCATSVKVVALTYPIL